MEQEDHLFKYLKDNPDYDEMTAYEKNQVNVNSQIFVGQNKATQEEKNELKKFDKAMAEMYGGHFIINYQEL